MENPNYMHLRPIRALRDVNRNLTEQLEAERAADEAAAFEITRSATQFSQRSKEVVDGTINLSAVLMRAGEVEEANRLLAEAEREVRTEEAVLIETVNEVRAQGLERRSRITRLKLLRMVATALLGGSVMVFSAFGVAVAKFLTEGPPVASAHEPARGSFAADTNESFRARERAARHVRVPGTDVRIALSGKELSDYLTLKKNPNIEAGDLRDFLLSIAPDDLVSRVVSAVASTALSTKAEAEKVVTRLSEEVEGEASKESAPSESPSAEPSESPQEEETDPSPEPSESDDTGREEKSDTDEDGGNSMLPEPLPYVQEPGDGN